METEEELQAVRESMLKSLATITVGPTEEDKRVEAQPEYLLTLEGRFRREVVADFNESESRWVAAFRNFEWFTEWPWVKP